MFNHLRTKLTVIYGGVLGVLLIALTITIVVFIRANAREQVDQELTATISVFERLWELTETQLSENAETVAQDFGFRSAVATGDIATVESALENLRTRLDIDRAFLVFPDKKYVEAGRLEVATAPAAFFADLKSDDHASGVLYFSEEPYQLVAAPVRAPTLVGWLVFASALDGERLGELEKLSPISVRAEIMSAAGDQNINSPGDISAFTVLGGFGGDTPAHLVLRYPLEEAMGPSIDVLKNVLAIALFGLSSLLVVSWLISRSVTGPIAYLDKATRALAQGEPVNLKRQSNQEIGRLTESFLHMAETVRTRERRITTMSLTDIETKLPNRRALEEAIRKSAEQQSEATLYCVAIGFHRLATIRSVIGHSAANKLVAALGARISEQETPIQFGRISGAVIGYLVRSPSVDALERRLHEMHAAMSEPVQIFNEVIDVQTTIAYAPHEPNNELGAIDRAAIALLQLQAKRMTVGAFNAEEYGDPTGTLSLMSDMLKGLRDGSVFLAYQPKLSLRDREISSAEALVRWRHPERGFIPPDKFIEFAEETGHIRPFSDWLIERASQDRETFRQAGHDICISVNLSGRLLSDEEFISRSIERLKDEPSAYCMEITETAVIDDPDAALRNINRLKQAGLSISIDDYGAGLSSLSYLKRIPGDELKIDKEFILEMHKSASDALLVKSTIDLAHGLNMKVTAEGIETPEVLQILSSMGADTAQGYYISKPLPVEDFIAFLSKWSKDDAPSDREDIAAAGA